ncbi:MAG: hypothetical protein OXU28_15025 [Chloroflexota bacterium]|nr:hypothetical protein [Chloroflexota bacterium]
MGSVQHHQAQARRFLSLARSDHNAGRYDRAANALARAASHAATAVVVHETNFRRRSRRKLTNRLFALAAEGRISNGGVRIFRNIYALPDRLAGADVQEAQRLSRQARTRVAMLVRSVEGAISGRPVTGRARRPPRPPWRPAPRSVSEIIALPDYREIARAHNLEGAPLARRPDPHGFYDRGQEPPRCPCHPVKLPLREEGDTIELSPLWQRALERVFRTPFPHTIPISAA